MSHTCFNQLVLPTYKNKKTLRTKLLTAIQNAEGFGLEWNMEMNNGWSFKKKKIGSGSTAVQFTHLFEKETLKIKKKTTKQKSYYQIIFSYLWDY